MPTSSGKGHRAIPVFQEVTSLALPSLSSCRTAFGAASWSGQGTVLEGFWSVSYGRGVHGND